MPNQIWLERLDHMTFVASLFIWVSFIVAGAWVLTMIIAFWRGRRYAKRIAELNRGPRLVRRSLEKQRRW